MNQQYFLAKLADWSGKMKDKMIVVNMNDVAKEDWSNIHEGEKVFVPNPLGGKCLGTVIYVFDTCVNKKIQVG